MNSFMKNKLLEFSVEKERTDRENERLMNRISQLENNEEVRNTSMDILSEEHIQIYTYILIKNCEVRRISNTKIEEVLFNDSDKDDNISSIETNIITRLCTLLKVGNIEDRMKLGVYIRTIFSSCRYDYYSIKSKLLSYFSDLIHYEPEHETELKSKLRIKLRSDRNLLLSAMQYYDSSNRGYINFIDFRKVLQNLKIDLKEKYTEYMIYVMKKFEDDNISIEDLKYSNLIEILNQDQSKTESIVKTDNNEIVENDEGEVVITIEQFNEKIDKILSKLAEYLLNSKQKVRECFKDVITNGDSYEAIQLKDFIQIIQKIGIKLDTIDIYCIFTKLKYTDDQEIIDLAKLLEEMFNYGIFDENLSKDIHIPRTERNLTIVQKLRKYLNDKSFDSFIFSILSKVFILQEGANMVRYIEYDEFISFLREKRIIDEFDIFSEDERGYIIFNNNINISKLKELIERNDIETINITHKDNYNNDDSLDLGIIEDGEIEGLDI
jgi:Ca2+-binding EF-hand superfamily protein